MASTWVLKLAQVDKPTQPILIHVTRKHDTQLDLDLLATDGEEAFRGKVRQRNLSKLKSQNFEGSDKQWEALLRYAFVSKKDSSAPENQTNPLEVDCSLADRGSKPTLTISLRSRIEDITHRLGSIELAYSENTDDIDLFGWSCQLADQRDELEKEIITTRKAGVAHKTTISGLRTQLDELVQAKNEHEEQLLAKFAELLNEKKLKIRNQQRILSTAKIDQKALDKLQVTLDGNEKTTSASKRKRAQVEQAAETEEEDESDGFDAMDIDKAGDGGQDARGTPPRYLTPETETASEDDGDVIQTKPTSAAKADPHKMKDPSPPPPPRTLPFQRKGQKVELMQKTEPAKQTKPAAKDDNEVDDDETESEDDEL